MTVSPTANRAAEDLWSDIGNVHVGQHDGRVVAAELHYENPPAHH